MTWMVRVVLIPSRNIIRDANSARRHFAQGRPKEMCGEWGCRRTESNLKFEI